MLKTPLRYPGGKSKATNKMAPYFPPKNNVKHYREPFLGGGSVALWMQQNYNLESVWVNDLYWPLYNFWIHLQKVPTLLSDELKEAKLAHNDEDKARILFLVNKDILNDPDETPFAKAKEIADRCKAAGWNRDQLFAVMADVGVEAKRLSECSLAQLDLIEGALQLALADADAAATRDAEPAPSIKLRNEDVYPASSRYAGD